MTRKPFLDFGRFTPPLEGDAFGAGGQLRACAAAALPSRPSNLNLDLSRRFSDARPGNHAWLIGLAVFLAVVLRVPLLVAPHAVDDEVVYAVVANEIVAGGQPYVDAVERKPPLLFWTYAAVFRLFGAFNWIALHGVAVAWVLVTMAGIYCVGRTLFDGDVGATGALLYAIYQVWGTWNNLAFNGEVLMNLPIAWAYALVFARGGGRSPASLAGAGALLGIACLLKQPALIAALPLGLYVYRTAGRSGEPPAFGAAFLQPAMIGLGFTAVLLLVGGFLQARGLLADAWYWSVGDHDVPTVFWQYGARKTIAFVLVCAPLVAGAAASAATAGLWTGREAERDALVGLTLVSTIGAFSTGRFFGHYYIAIVLPLAMLAAPAILDVRVVLRQWTRSPAADSIGPVWIVRGAIGATAAAFLSLHAAGLSRQPADTEAGRYLRAHAQAGERLFVWGRRTRLYLDSRLRPASRYIDTFPLTGHVFGPNGEAVGAGTESRVLPGAWTTLPRDFARHPPAYIVDAESGPEARYPMARFAVLSEIVAREYQAVARTADGVIYRRIAPVQVAQDAAPPAFLASRPVRKGMMSLQRTEDIR